MPAKGADARVLTGDALLARFVALDAFLIEHQALWKPRPFTHLRLPWEASYPELAVWLRGRSLEDAEDSHNQPCLLDAPEPFASLAALSLELGSVGDLPAHTLESAGHRLNVDVPGRKWQQIEAFASRLSFAVPPKHWLDWCSGKGHLGRRLLRIRRGGSAEGGQGHQGAGRDGDLGVVHRHVSPKDWAKRCQRPMTGL